MTYNDYLFGPYFMKKGSKLIPRRNRFKTNKLQDGGGIEESNGNEPEDL